MTLIKRWYEPMRWGVPRATDTLFWRETVDGRACLVSGRTPQAYVARWIWAKWRYWVMHRAYYPLIRTLEVMCVIEIPDGVEHRLGDWKTFSVRESTTRNRHYKRWSRR